MVILLLGFICFIFLCCLYFVYNKSSSDVADHARLQAVACIRLVGCCWFLSVA
jgi:cbb3-type cytochrome oxidase subunit 3